MKLLLPVLFCIALSVMGIESHAEPRLLWPDGAPGAKGSAAEDIPEYTVHRAPEAQANGAAVVVCPGGGYGALAMGHEGADVAAWLNAHGIHAIILKYRLSPYRHPVMLNDAKRAVRTVRAHADTYGIDPERIGIMGFSAGGHLASSVLVHFDGGNADADDPIERVSSRPDFGILVYPVITFTEDAYIHRGSMRNLLGENPPAELVQKMSTEKQVKEDTPPVFLMHTSGDTGVPPENSVLFYLALREKGIPAELHIYEKGRHGFGLAPDDAILSSWPTRAIDWLRSRGIIPMGE